MSLAEPSTVSRSAAARRSAAQTRIVAAALDLFAEHGVSGTSLQMIADAIGVTKAAVYHQFKTKEEIVLAVGRGRAREARGRARRGRGREPTAPAPRRAARRRSSTSPSQRRRMVSTLQHDPSIVRLLARARAVPRADGSAVHAC